MVYGFNEDKSKAEIYVAIIYLTSSPTIQANSTGTVLFDTSQIGGEILGLKSIIFYKNIDYSHAQRTSDLAIMGYEVTSNGLSVMVKNTSSSAMNVTEFGTVARVTCIAGTVQEIDTDTDD